MIYRHVFQTDKDTYNERQFRQFNYIVEMAKKYKIKLIVTLANYWSDYGGIQRYLEWGGIKSDNPGVFFTDETAKQIYKDYVECFVTEYKDDPTIFAWELCNGPRYQGFGEDESSETLRGWVDEMGGFIKNIDPNHLISSGLEGQGTRYNYGWNAGNDFVKIHESKYIDFCTAQMYPTDEDKAGRVLSIDETKGLLAAWINDCNKIGKPFFLGEFNVANDESRTYWWDEIYKTIRDLDAGGDAFWWYQSLKVRDGDEDEPDEEYGIRDGTPELAMFKIHSHWMKMKSNKEKVRKEEPQQELQQKQQEAMKLEEMD